VNLQSAGFEGARMLVVAWLPGPRRRIAVKCLPTQTMTKRRLTIHTEKSDTAAYSVESDNRLFLQP
jgi:hypothetical protein